jgi:GNAT superfamily N-acetyltransferase
LKKSGINVTDRESRVRAVVPRGLAMEIERRRDVEVIGSHLVRELGPEHLAELVRLGQCLDPPVCISNRLATASWAAGVFVDQRLRGLVEGRDPADPSFVEVSFVVEPSWRGRGLGRALLEAAIYWGKTSGRSTLRMIFSRNDWSMRKLATKANARFDIVLDRMSADISLLAIPGPRPNQIGEHHG